MTKEDEDPHPGMTLFDLTTKETITIDDSGRFVRTLNGKKEVLDSYNANNCYGTAYKGSVAECERFIASIYDATEIKDIILDDDSFNLASRQEIERIHPKTAVLMLRKFGFREKQSDFMGRPSLKFEDVSSWLSHLSELGFDDTKIANMQNMNKLKKYLQTLVNFVNANPAILNGSTHAVADFEENSYLRRLGIKMLPRMPLDVATTNIHQTMRRLAENVGIAHRLLEFPSAVLPNFRFHFLPKVMTGGMKGGNGKQLRSLINGLLRDLERKNKRINSVELKQINDMLDYLEKAEVELSIFASRLAEYKDWINLIPNNKVETLTLESLKQQIEHYKECVAQRATAELGIIQIALGISRALI